jgi:hypothetical protein
MANLGQPGFTKACWMGLLIVCVGTVPVRGQSPAPRTLADVPEAMLDLHPVGHSRPADAQTRLKDAVFDANERNMSKIDGFVKDTRAKRPDLHGMPYLMADACRMPGERFQAFAAAGEAAHAAVRLTKSRDGKARANAKTMMSAAFEHGYFDALRDKAGLPDPDGVTTQMTQLLVPRLALPIYKVKQAIARAGVKPEEFKPEVSAAQTAALMQILAPEPAELRVSLANYLARLPGADATRALARLAVFSEESSVRNAATGALKGRAAKDYDDVLKTGLRYPWPAVAEYAAEAIVQLKRTELVAELLGTLEQPDPRAPTLKEIDGKKTYQVREVVRVNHHRNCLLCHAPGNTADVAREAIRAPIPVPGRPLHDGGGYGSPPPDPDLIVRIDVTYLRQDFSMFLPVANAKPWPEKQRFDFLVRTRTWTETEAAANRSGLPSGTESPYHRAADQALRELTGRAASAPTAAAWREILAP